MNQYKSKRLTCRYIVYTVIREKCGVDVISRVAKSMYDKNTNYICEYGRTAVYLLQLVH